MQAAKCCTTGSQRALYQNKYHLAIQELNISTAQTPFVSQQLPLDTQKFKVAGWKRAAKICLQIELHVWMHAADKPVYTCIFCWLLCIVDNALYENSCIQTVTHWRSGNSQRVPSSSCLWVQTVVLICTLLQNLSIACELHMCHSLSGANLGCLHAGVASAQDPCLADSINLIQTFGGCAEYTVEFIVTWCQMWICQELPYVIVMSPSFDMYCEGTLRKPAQSGETRMTWLAKWFTGSSDIPCDSDHQNVLDWL